MSYEKGKGYKDGWSDRMEGKPNMSPSLRGCATTDNRVYWEEYVYGYADASRQVISDARKDIDEIKRFIRD